MSRVVMVVMVVVMGLCVMGQALSAKRVVEERHATLMSMMDVAGR